MTEMRALWRTENPRVGGSIPPLGTTFNAANSNTYYQLITPVSSFCMLHFFASFVARKFPVFPDDAASRRDMHATWGKSARPRCPQRWHRAWTPDFGHH